MGRPIRVLIVDDSAFTRHVLEKGLEADTGITVVGKARDGVEALDQVAALEPDVITLDVEMPRMDGLTALRRIMKEHPTPVVMLSALTHKGARETIQALMRGAVDFVPKPSTTLDIDRVMEELIAKVKIAAITPVTPDYARPAEPEPPPTTRVAPRAFRRGDPVLVIAASTGGPRALHQVLSTLPGDLPAAVLLVQHMPPSFTRALAERLNKNSPLTVFEAADGDRLARGLALLAPGDFHLSFSNSKQLKLDQGPRRNGVRPSADVTMESAAVKHGKAVIGTVLTGMGSDGTDGARYVKAAGGKIIAEHESSSAVYGMPRSVIEAGLADRIVPLPEVAATILELL
ncbi:MAG TPA: chemotaxis response regulator protein-glutamate methylesterase [Chloroflexi bacterium]|nr:chemotaxis response regulator protein-glutamate methylesterase [Chloroflexota bacterium]